MKKFLTCVALSTMLCGTAIAEDVKLGILLGFTGPIESLAGSMASSAELAISEVNKSKVFLNGSTVTSVRADSTCIDSNAATASAERLITSDKVHAIVGVSCSGATAAVLQNVALSKGIVMVSPSATSPSLTTMKIMVCFFVLRHLMRGKAW